MFARPASCAALLGALVLAAALPARAQTPCVDGSADGYSCEGVALLGHVPLSTLGSGINNDLWGWTDPDTGHEIALVGMENGLAFVDVTEPTAPLYLGKLPTATEPSIWRDVKVYADHAFVVADGASNHGMQIFDLTRLRDVTSPPVTLDPDVVYHGATGHSVGSAHNIVMDEDAGLVAIVGSGDCGGGLHLVDVTDPLNPAFQACFGAEGYTHDALCTLYEGPDADHLGQRICIGFQGWSGSVAIVDVTDPANPTLIARGFYPNPGYTHQGWFTEDQRHLLVDDELDDDASNATRTAVLNVEDLDNPEFDFFFFGPLETTDHNLYVRGPYAFLSNYEGGLRIVDLSGIDDGTLTEVGHFDTYPAGDVESFNGQWSNYPYFESGVVIANDRQNGLFTLRADVLPTAAEPSAEPPPSAHALLSAPVPNPAGDRAALSFTAAEAGEVVAEVLDLRGRRVALLYEGPAAAGTALPLTVDTADLPAGLYLVRVRGARFSATRRLSVVH